MNQSFLLGYASKIIYSQSRFGIFIVFEIYCLNYKKKLCCAQSIKEWSCFMQLHWTQCYRISLMFTLEPHCALKEDYKENVNEPVPNLPQISTWKFTIGHWAREVCTRKGKCNINISEERWYWRSSPICRTLWFYALAFTCLRTVYAGDCEGIYTLRKKTILIFFRKGRYALGSSLGLS